MELSCDLMGLVYVGAQLSEPSSALHVKGLSVRDEASLTPGQKSAFPRKGGLSPGQDSLCSRRMHMHTQTKYSFCIGLTAPPSLLLQS